MGNWGPKLIVSSVTIAQVTSEKWPLPMLSARRRAPAAYHMWIAFNCLPHNGNRQLLALGCNQLIHPHSIPETTQPCECLLPYRLIVWCVWERGISERGVWVRCVSLRGNLLTPGRWEGTQRGCTLWVSSCSPWWLKFAASGNDHCWILTKEPESGSLCWGCGRVGWKLSPRGVFPVPFIQL